MKMGKTLLAYLPVNLANVLVSFGTIVVLTRLLGSEEFGRYAIAIITMQFFHQTIFTWLEAAAARYQARAEREASIPSHLRVLYGGALVLSAVGLLGAFLVFKFAPLNDDLRTVVAFAMTTTCVQVLFNIGMETHRAAHRITRYSLTYSAQTGLSFVIGITLVLFTPLRELGPFVGILMGLIFGLMIDGPFMAKRMSGGTIDAARVRRYALYGLPISASVLLGYALNSADVFIIAAFMGEAAAGQYSAGYNLANRTLEILFIWLSMAATPMAITAIEQKTAKETQAIMRQYGGSLLAIAMPAAVGIALVAQDAGFILGESVRAEAVTVMPLIAVAGLLNGLITYYVHRAFMLSGRTGAIVWIMVPAVALNLALNVILIPDFGLMGAVYATLISYAMTLVMSVLAARKHYPLPLPIVAFGKIALACAAMAGAILALPMGALEPGVLTLMIKASVGGAIYAVMALALNIADCRALIRVVNARIFDRQREVETPIEAAQ